MKARYWIAAAAALGLAGTALADAPVKVPGAPCFFSRNWDSWRSPDENTIYLRVGLKDVFRVDLSAGSRMLTYSDSHLISHMRGTDSVCSALDLDLKVSDGSIVEPLFVKSITKLTPEQITAIPKKFLP